jgi:pyruvate dehydrogenase E1 component alpha subunit
MASKWKLPVIYICENNRYGMGTAITRVAAVHEMHKRAGAYAMRGEKMDGMDALAVFETVADCAEYARSGKGPVLLEANTYRFRGHSMADPATYRQKTEVEDERKNDPIPKLRAHILKVKAATEKELDAIDAEVKKEVDAAVKFADESPEPSLDELWRDTIVEPGEEDVKPRERVLGQKVKWPSYPSGQELKVTWVLEPDQTESQSEPRAAAASRAEESKTDSKQAAKAEKRAS